MENEFLPGHFSGTDHLATKRTRYNSHIAKKNSPSAFAFIALLLALCFPRLQPMQQ
jgi:hypothetical protein